MGLVQSQLILILGALDVVVGADVWMKMALEKSKGETRRDDCHNQNKANMTRWKSTNLN